MIKVGDKIKVVDNGFNVGEPSRTKLVGYVREIRECVYSGKTVVDFWAVAGFKGMCYGFYINEVISAN